MKHFTKYFVFFVALTAMAVALLSPAGDHEGSFTSRSISFANHLQDIWNSPGRLTAIEADIDEINERLSAIELDKNRFP